MSAHRLGNFPLASLVAYPQLPKRLFAYFALEGKRCMSDISTLKEKNNIKTFHLILLTLITMGLYPVVWLYKTAALVEEITRIKTLSQTCLVVYLACCGIGGILFTISDLTFIIAGYALTLIAQLIAIAWCFRVRRALRAYTLTEYGFELRMNRLYSVLFGFYHINYCINDMARAKHKDDQKRQTPMGSVTA